MIKIKNAEILCVGTEILIGDIVNTNAAFISARLASLGIEQYYQAVVGDNPRRLKEAIMSALSRSSLLVITGGLGPTYDDLTKETAAECMQRELVRDEKILHDMCEYFKILDCEMTENNFKQADIPKGAYVFVNTCGTAPGCAIEDEENGKMIIMLPGPPHEMKTMWEKSVEGFLSEYTEKFIISKNINITGIGESAAAEMINDIMTASDNPTAAPYCGNGEVRIRVTASDNDRDRACSMCDSCIEKIKESHLGKYIYGVDSSLSEAVGEYLRKRGMTLCTAESCTGGLIGKLMTEIPGISDVYLGGVISYANSVKENILGVNRETLETVGAVSYECACEMAIGVRKITGADVGISVTGIAGPGGGTPEKPVGTVFVGISTQNGTEAFELHRRGTREYIRSYSANFALRKVLELS